MKSSSCGGWGFLRAAQDEHSFSTQVQKFSTSCTWALLTSASAQWWCSKLIHSSSSYCSAHSVQSNGPLSVASQMGWRLLHLLSPPDKSLHAAAEFSPEKAWGRSTEIPKCTSSMQMLQAVKPLRCYWMICSDIFPSIWGRNAENMGLLLPVGSANTKGEALSVLKQMVL